MESKLNERKFVKFDSQLSIAQLTFIGVHKIVEDNEGDIESLKMRANDKVIDEASFREMLINVISYPLDENKLSESERNTLNKITLYLSEPMEDEIEKPKAESTTSIVYSKENEENKEKLAFLEKKMLGL